MLDQGYELRSSRHGFGWLAQFDCLGSARFPIGFVPIVVAVLQLDDLARVAQACLVPVSSLGQASVVPLIHFVVGVHKD
jgi:hypothetical protein